MCVLSGLQSCADNEPHMSCVAITCDISDLRANESSTIRIDGYVDSQTFAVRVLLMCSELLSHTLVYTGHYYTTHV